MSKFVIFKASNDKYYFHLKAGNGEKILASQGYIYKSSCKDGIASVKDNARYDSQYEKRTSVSNQYYFVLKAGNGEIIGTSEMYTSSSSRDSGIEVVKREAPNADVEDIS